MKISDTRKRLVGEMYSYIDKVVTYAIEHKRKLVIWGCGKGGAFLQHLICDIDGRVEISYYIDEYMVLPCCNEKSNIFRASLLWYLPKDEYVVLLSIRKDPNAERLLNELGYEKNKDYFDIRNEIGGSYLEYLELQNNKLDFSYVTKADEPELYSGDYYESKPFDHSSVDNVFEQIERLPCEKSFLDIGCGKGQILLMAAMNGMEHIAGIEWNPSIANVAKRNMKELDISSNILIGDATEYTSFEEYSIFFLYNPFGESGIRKVVKNICNSLKERKRDVFLVYGNPFFHNAIIECKNVDIYQQVGVDLYDPILNIYRMGGCL